jgi:hypothetical protein
MALQGLDKDVAPPAAKAKAMLDEIHGTWWNVYIGGPRSKGSGWTPDRVREYVEHGITRFLLIYVGRQSEDAHLLTTSQGRDDGNEACRIAGRFGYGAGTPICLDLEGRTFDKSPRGSLDYACGWCRAVRAQGLRPGVYSNPRALIPLADRSDRPDWVWVAAWITNKVDPNVDPHRNPKMPDNLYSKAGQRAWQYGGEFHGAPAKVGGVEVDINVADSACLAGTRPAFGAGLVTGGLTMAEAQDILNRLQSIYEALRDGSDTNMNSLKNIRGHVVAIEADVKALKADVQALKDAHPHG